MDRVLENLLKEKQEINNAFMELKEREEKVSMLIVKQEEINSPELRATNLWCKITNALIAKYKTMSEENPNEVVKQLTRLEGALLAGKFLTEEELEKGL